MTTHQLYSVGTYVSIKSRYPQSSMTKGCNLFSYERVILPGSRDVIQASANLDMVPYATYLTTEGRQDPRGQPQ